MINFFVMFLGTRTWKSDFFWYHEFFIKFHFLGAVTFKKNSNVLSFCIKEAIFISQLASGHSFFNIFISKTNFQIGIFGHLKVMWRFTLISWRQGLKMRHSICIANYVSSTVRCFFHGLYPKIIKIDLIGIYFKNLYLCQIHEASRLHLKDDGTISLLFEKLLQRA